MVGVGKEEVKGIEADASGVSESTGGHVSRMLRACLRIE
jgi:hypothetical protein